jgi:hypothetical protein
MSAEPTAAETISEPEAQVEGAPADRDEATKEAYLEAVDSLGLREKPPEPEPAWDRAAAEAELERLDRETGQDVWREQRAAEKAAAEQAAVEYEQSLLAEVAWRDDELAAYKLAEATEALQEAVAFGDDADAARIAERFSAEHPDASYALLEQWREQDPTAAGSYEAMQDMRQLVQEAQWERAEAERQYQAQVIAQAFEAQRAREALRAQAQDVGRAIEGELDQLRRDPVFKTFAPEAEALAAQALIHAVTETGALPSTFEAQTYIRTGYELALAMRKAKEEAVVMLPFDEADWRYRQRTEDLLPWNRDEAFPRLVSERLQLREPGALIADRRAQQRGYKNAEHLARAEKLASEVDERNALSRRMQQEFAEGHERAKAANAEFQRRTGRRRLR